MEDRLDILELCARYQQLFDDGMSEAWADTFCPDGYWGDPGAALCRSSCSATSTYKYMDDSTG